MKKILPVLAALITLFAANSVFAVSVRVNGSEVAFSPGDGQPFIAAIWGRQTVE